MRIVPELEPYFVTIHESGQDRHTLAHGRPQHVANLGYSLTTTASVVATLNSVIAGSLASAVCGPFGGGRGVDAAVGGALSLVSGALHVLYAARYRRRHIPTARNPSEAQSAQPDD